MVNGNPEDLKWETNGVRRRVLGINRYDVCWAHPREATLGKARRGELPGGHMTSSALLHFCPHTTDISY